MNKENLKPCLNDMCIKYDKTRYLNCGLFDHNTDTIKRVMKMNPDSRVVKIITDRIKNCKKYKPENPQSALVCAVLHLIQEYNKAEGEMWIPDYVEPVLKNELFPLLEKIMGKKREEIEKELEG